jgi:choline-glycine betaine transporter
MNKSKLSYGALISGSVITLIGIILCIAYVSEAIVARIGEPDQSLLFWYLPILFMGLFGMGIGIVLIFWGKNSFKKTKKQSTKESS